MESEDKAKAPASGQPDKSSPAPRKVSTEDLEKVSGGAASTPRTTDHSVYKP